MTFFDRLAANRVGQLLLLSAGPIAVYGLVFAVNLFSGTAVAAHCDVTVVFREGADHTGVFAGIYRLFPFIDLRGTPVSSCRSVPFTADGTNQVLALTTGLAISIYLVFIARMRRLRQDFHATGLLTQASEERSGLTEMLARPSWHQAPRTLRIGGNVVLLAVSTILSVLMYNWTYLRGPIFADLAGSYTRMGSANVTEAQLRDTWWANHTHHPVHTAVGILVGAIGLFVATKQGMAFIKLARYAWQVRRLRDRAPAEFVPKWLDPDHGWGPAGTILSLGYVAAFAFLASFTAALYMLRTQEPGLFQTLQAILAVIALLGLLGPGVLLITLNWTIRNLFAASVERERRGLKQRLDAADAALANSEADALASVSSLAVRVATADERLYLLTRASALVDMAANPLRLRERVLRFLAAGPILLAGLKFFDEITRAFGGG